MVINNKTCRICNIKQSLNNFQIRKENNYRRNECKNCITLYNKNYGLKNKTKILKKNKDYYKNNIDKFKNYRLINKDIIFQKQNEYYKKRRKIDPLFKLKYNLRIRLNKSLHIKKWNKNNHFIQYIGCTLEQLKQHFESKFTKGMSWERYLTTSDIHIDHIIPLSSAKTIEDMHKLCHYTNLQPLWAIDNMHKSSKLNYNLINGDKK